MSSVVSGAGHMLIASGMHHFITIQGEKDNSGYLWHFSENNPEYLFLVIFPPLLYKAVPRTPHFKVAKHIAW